MMALTRVTKECLWRLVMRSAGISADRFDDLEKTADPRQVLLDLIAEKDKKGTILHLILLLTWKGCDIIYHRKSIERFDSGYLTP